jgi:hypothetical protein
MFVAAETAELYGYIIAQPCSPWLVPITHEIAAIGVIDDFYDENLANPSASRRIGVHGVCRTFWNAVPRRQHSAHAECEERGFRRVKWTIVVVLRTMLQGDRPDVALRWDLAAKRCHPRY